MRKYYFVYFLVIAISLVVGCAKDTVTEHYTFYRPIYDLATSVKERIKSAAPLPVQSPGKLAVRGNYIFLSELNKGVHIIDFSNPRTPLNIGFVAIPGNADLAVRDNYLYADCYKALVVIDISHPESAHLVNYLNNVFPERYQGLTSDTMQVIIDWQRVDTVVTHPFEQKFDQTLNYGVLTADAFASASSSKSNTGNSTGGSMARFALKEDRLYTVSFSDLKVFNTANASLPQFVKTVGLQAGDIETIFPYKEQLFIGAQTGVHIYNVSNKDNPVFLSKFVHVRMCDPVIAADNYAYVTLRDGSNCGKSPNELEILNITDVTNPVLLKSYALKGPKGLSKDGSLLFICDGTDGVKIFNAADPMNLKLVRTITGIDAADVIAQDGVAIVMATDGLYFIDYKNPGEAGIIARFSLTE
jgi:hypothetical protein